MNRNPPSRSAPQPAPSRSRENAEGASPSLRSRTSRWDALRRQVGRLERRIAKLERRGDRFVRTRLALFLAGALVSGSCFLGGRALPGWIALAAFAASFAVAGTLHSRSKAALRRHRLWTEIRFRQLSRISLDWSAIPEDGPPQLRVEHPFEHDLDVTGPRSLHRLLDTSVSEGGSQVLRDWLLERRPEEMTIRRRRELVRELTPRSLFRDKLTLQAELSPGWDGKKLSEKSLLDWLERETASKPLRRALLLYSALIAVNAGLFALWLFGGVPMLFLFTTMAGIGFLLTGQAQVEKLFGDGLLLEKTFDRHHRVFSQLESFNYGGLPRVGELCRLFWEPGTRPSRRLRRVARLVSALSVRAYFPAWILLNLLAPWDFHFALRLQREKEALRELLPAWLEAWFECEAVNSLANFAWLHPGYATPRLDLAADGLDAQELGHPLIPNPERVCNDFSLRGLGKIVLVTGSNMAGKSTFLRTVGLNLCLAQAGGPVCARSFRWSPVRVRSCIRVADSLSDGFSYFYAEVRRLKLILEELKSEDSIPVFFLIDEIFKGTNNRERLIGSRSYIRALVSKNGLGLISTHDLELAGLADEVPSLENRHFREEVLEGRMEFDYRLRPGPCPTTNALKIMEMQGLPVGE